MSHTNCPQESAVARAVRSSEWSEALEAHLRDCADCRGVKEATRWMQALASVPAREAQEGLPDPRVLWLRAQFSERQAATERAHKVLQWVEIACVAAACAGLGIWLAWDWNEVGGTIGDGMNWALFEAWPALWSSLDVYGPVNAPILFSAVLTVISLLALAVAYPLLARE